MHIKYFLFFKLVHASAPYFIIAKMVMISAAAPAVKVAKVPDRLQLHRRTDAVAVLRRIFIENAR